MVEYLGVTRAAYSAGLMATNSADPSDSRRAENLACQLAEKKECYWVVLLAGCWAACWAGWKAVSLVAHWAVK